MCLRSARLKVEKIDLKMRKEGNKCFSTFFLSFKFCNRTVIGLGPKLAGDCPCLHLVPEQDFYFCRKAGIKRPHMRLATLRKYACWPKMVATHSRITVYTGVTKIKDATWYCQGPKMRLPVMDEGDKESGSCCVW